MRKLAYELKGKLNDAKDEIEKLKLYNETLRKALEEMIKSPNSQLARHIGVNALKYTK